MPTGGKLKAQDEATRKAIALTFAFLKRRGIDQNMVARRLRVGHQIVSMVKTGKRTPSIRQIGVLWELSQEATKAVVLNQEEFQLVGKVALAWQKAIDAQTDAVQDLLRQVSRKLNLLQAETQPSEDDLQRITECANETLRLGAGLQQLAELRKAWQAVGMKFFETWKRIKAERYPDGPPPDIGEVKHPRQPRQRGQRSRV